MANRVFVLFFALLVGCGSPGGSTGVGPAPGPAPAPGSGADPGGSAQPAPGPAAPMVLQVGEACAAPGPLLDVSATLPDRGNPCRDWLEATYGRVLRQTVGSAVIWSRRTQHRTGVLVSANHVLGEGWYGEPGSDVAATIEDPAAANGVPRLFRALPAGFEERTSPLFGLYHPEIPGRENRNGMQDILPRHDFFVGVVDAQLLAYEQMPGPLGAAELPIHDPAQRTLEPPTWAEVAPGDRVLVMGVPMEGELAGRMAASVGRVLTDEETAAAQRELRRHRDVEGRIRYEPEVEMFIEGSAITGMSGGGAFDTDGRVVGILVRASTDHPSRQFVRAVRMSYVVARVREAVDALEPERRTAIETYLGSLD